MGGQDGTNPRCCCVVTSGVLVPTGPLGRRCGKTGKGEIPQRMTFGPIGCGGLTWAYNISRGGWLGDVCRPLAVRKAKSDGETRGPCPRAKCIPKHSGYQIGILARKKRRPQPAIRELRPVSLSLWKLENEGWRMTIIPFPSSVQLCCLSTSGR